MFDPKERQKMKKFLWKRQFVSKTGKNINFFPHK